MLDWKSLHGSFERLLGTYRISVLKRRHDLHRCRYHGADGMARAVGLGVIASNLLSIAAHAERRTRAAA